MPTLSRVIGPTLGYYVNMAPWNLTRIVKGNDKAVPVCHNLVIQPSLLGYIKEYTELFSSVYVLQQGQPQQPEHQQQRRDGRRQHRLRQREAHRQQQREAAERRRHPRRLVAHRWTGLDQEQATEDDCSIFAVFPPPTGSVVGFPTVGRTCGPHQP